MGVSSDGLVSVDPLDEALVASVIEAWPQSSS